MKNLIKITVISLLFVSNSFGQKERINTLEDTFIQGGDTSDEVFGETNATLLRIGASDKDSKYARIAYLKFKLPSKLEDVKEINLFINIKVFRKDKYPDATFKLSVFGIENDKWKENEITWEDPLELGNKIGFVDLPQTETDKTTKVKIKLDLDELKKLAGKKDKIISLGLASYDSKLSAIITSKDKSPKFGSYLRIIK